MPNVNNVTAVKPAIEGSVYSGPTSLASTLISGSGNSAVPAKITIPSTMKNLGYVADSGLKNSISRSTSTIKSWGGDTVMTTQTEFTDTFTLTLLESKNADVLKEVFGESNVTTDENGIHVRVNSSTRDKRLWAFDMIDNEGKPKRVVIPLGQITEVGELSYTDGEALGFAITLTAYCDSNGQTHYTSDFTSAPAEG